MDKFEITYIPHYQKTVEVKARDKEDAVKRFREVYGQHCAIDSVKYIYDGNEELKEYYCYWCDINNNWHDRVVQAHNEKEVRLNVVNTLGQYKELYICPNTPKHISDLFRIMFD